MIGDVFARSLRSLFCLTKESCRCRTVKDLKIGAIDKNIRINND